LRSRRSETIDFAALIYAHPPRSTKEMKFLKNALQVLLGVYIGLSVVWMPPHPARLAVSEVRKEIINYYEANQAVPASLEFIKEKRIRSDIMRYKITWNPNQLEIESEGNWTYEADILYRATFGLIGNRVSSSHGNPGHILSHTIPQGTKVEPVVMGQ
jgi:hypothetical protein